MESGRARISKCPVVVSFVNLMDMPFFALFQWEWEETVHSTLREQRQESKRKTEKLHQSTPKQFTLSDAVRERDLKIPPLT